MKTKQEQIKKMTSIIVETLQDKRVKNGTTFVTYLPSLFGNNPDKEKEVAEALIENGYGDVSEYKAEIERLKEENEQSRKLRILGNEVTVEFLDDAVSEPSADCKDIEKYAKQFRNRIISINEKEVKQAKIDVLNEAKELSVHSDQWNCKVVPIEYIDELIAEIGEQ